MKKLFKKIPKSGALIILCIIAAVILIYSILLRVNAKQYGGSLGAGTGALVGKAVGSLKGMTVGRTEGLEAGKEAGLSAEDTEADIANRIQQVENLEVLVASVKLKNFHQIGGNDKSPDYAALYLVNGTVVFTVDMSQAVISEKDDGLYIVLPQPIGSLYLEESSVKKAAEYQKRFFSGSAEDGFDAYINTMAKIQEASEETLGNYESLIVAAKSAATKQVKQLAESVSVSAQSVIIEWADSGRK